MHGLAGFGATYVENGYWRAIQCPQCAGVHHRQLRHLVAVIEARGMRSSPRSTLTMVTHGDCNLSTIEVCVKCTERTANALSDSPLPSLSQLKILAPILVAPWLYASVATALA